MNVSLLFFMCAFTLSKTVKVYCKREEGTKTGGGKRKRGERNGVEWVGRTEQKEGEGRGEEEEIPSVCHQGPIFPAAPLEFLWLN